MMNPGVTRGFGAVLLIVGALFGISAKCLENDSLRIGEDGNWHVYGEIHNETDVQGLDMVLNGAVFDAAGQQIAVAQALMCPASLSPGTFSVYDIGFVLPAGVAPDTHQVNVVQGTADSEPLPALMGAFHDITTAAQFYQGPARDKIAYQGTFTLAESELTAIQPGEPAPRFMYCTALYDDDGDVIGLIPPTARETFADISLTTKKGTAPITTPSDSEFISRDAVTLRFIVWRVSPEGAPLSAPAISDPVVITWL
jgi:hypothetical protein